MGDGLVPVEYWELQPAYKNFFENGAAVQFNHRLLVLLLFKALHALLFIILSHLSSNELR
jgi:heme A synthase